MNNEIDYINTILNQLYAGGKMLVWSWGAHGFTRLDDITLTFKVNATRLKGYVYIRYCFGSDTYKIMFSGHLPKFSNTDKAKYEIINHEKIKPLDDVYCEDMTRFIDDEIERIPEYKN